MAVPARTCTGSQGDLGRGAGGARDDQAKKFGARITIPGEAVGLEALDGTFRLRLRDGESVIGRAVVVASGVRYRRLLVADLAKFEGTSVHYAATQIEAQLCQGDPVVMVGGGNSAGPAVLLLSRYVPHLSLVVREQDLGDNMSRCLVDRIASTPSVDVLTHCEVRELVGDDKLEAVIVENTETGERRRIVGACPACSRPATLAAARRSASQPRSATARSRSARCTSSLTGRLEAARLAQTYVSS